MNKITKIKILTGSMFALAAVSLTGIAFGTWLVQNDVLTATEGAVTVTVGEVKDSSISITNLKVTDGNIAFEPKEENTTGPVKYDGTNKEDLDFTFTFTVVNALDGNGVFASRFGGVHIYWKPETNLKAAITNNYIKTPKLGDKALVETSEAPGTLFDNSITISNTGITGLTLTPNGSAPTNLDVTVTYSFSWGDEFETKNPAEFITTENYETEIETLKAFTNMLNDNRDLTIYIAPYLVS